LVISEVNKKMEYIYYFGYGSNMDRDDLNRWCSLHAPGFKFPEMIGTGRLAHYRLAFDYYSPGRQGGVADIISAENESVYGILFRISREFQEKVLRIKEGYPKLYNEISVAVSCKGQIYSEVITYRILDEQRKSHHIMPDDYYFNLIYASAVQFDFPQQYLEYLKSLKQSGK